MRGAKTEQDDLFIFPVDTTGTPLSLPTPTWRLPDPVWGQPGALDGKARQAQLSAGLGTLTRQRRGGKGKGEGVFSPYSSGGKWKRKRIAEQRGHEITGSRASSRTVVALRLHSHHPLGAERQSL